MYHLIFENEPLGILVHKTLSDLSSCWIEEDNQTLHLPEETYNDYDLLEVP